MKMAKVTIKKFVPKCEGKVKLHKKRVPKVKIPGKRRRRLFPPSTISPEEGGNAELHSGAWKKMANEWDLPPHYLASKRDHIYSVAKIKRLCGEEISPMFPPESVVSAVAMV